MVLSDRNRFRAWQILIFLFIAAASLASYWGTSSLFFYADDFFWLERGKFLSASNLSAIFSVEKFGGLYFDPLVHLSFYLNHLAFGLDPAWYHRVDIFIHTINAILVAYLTLLLTNNITAVFFSGLMFAISHTNSDSVIWPSARVDTLAALFYLLSIISYRLHMIRKSAGYYLLSAVFFITSLASKSTPVILPFILFSLEILYNQEERRLYKAFLKLLPFFLISIVFLMLLFLNSPGIPAKIDATNLNFKELLKGITVLFFPEPLIVEDEVFYIVLSIFLFIFFLSFSLMRGSPQPAIMGLIMILAIILPLLFLKSSFVYATATQKGFYYILGSIYHRLYLAVIGFAILVGVFVGALLKRNGLYKTLPGMLILSLLTITIFVSGYMNIQERKKIWRLGERQYVDIAESVKGLREEQNNEGYSIVYVINPPFTAFLDAMLKVYLDNEKLKMISFPHYSAIPDITSDENALIGMFISPSKIVNITQSVRMYQSGPAACKDLKNIEERRKCWDRLSALTQELNKLLYNN